jgi:hypothetical protein
VAGLVGFAILIYNTLTVFAEKSRLREEGRSGIARPHHDTLWNASSSDV